MPTTTMGSNVACDCHMHIFDGRFPFAIPTPLKPTIPATASDYLTLRRTLNLTRCVIVQPSGYGTDNRCLLDALHQLGASARGVAVVDDTVSDDQLHDLHHAGVRGIRFNLVQSGATRIEMLRTLAARVAGLGWHIQVHCQPETLAQIHPALASLPTDVVLDHMALAGTVPQDARHLGTVQRLLQQGKTWIKLSAPYLNDWRPDGTNDDLARIVRTFVTTAADRLVWASDWPHISESVLPDDTRMFDAIRSWVADDRLWADILSRNPTTLYDF